MIFHNQEYTLCHLRARWRFQTYAKFAWSINCTLIVFIAIPLSSQTIQKASNNWYFGDRAGLNFNTSAPTALTDGSLNTQEGVATISNELGELLFYTDGSTVYDKSHKPMPNGNFTLNGHFSSTQSAIIVPQLNDPDLFYIFTVDELGGSNGLSYSVVDISLPGNGNNSSPLGDVIASDLNISLVTPVTEKITAVLKPDLKSYWVLAHGWNNNSFYAFDIDCNGINPTPIESQIGSVHSGGSQNINAVGYMKASINGERLALVSRVTNSIDLFDFDKVTGIVSNDSQIFPSVSSL